MRSSHVAENQQHLSSVEPSDGADQRVTATAPASDGVRQQRPEQTQYRDSIKELLQQSERLLPLAHRGHDMMAVVDVDGTIRLAHASNQHVLGYEPESLIGRNAFELLHEDHLPRATAALATVLHGSSRSRSVQLRVRHQDGSWRALEVAVTNRLEDPEVRGVFVSARDVSAARETEAELRETRRMLATLLANLPGMVYRCLDDEARTMEFVSEGCLGLTGYYAADLLGNGRVAYSDLVLEADRKSVSQRIEAAVRDKQPLSLIYRITTPTGEEKWVSEHGQGVYSPEGVLLALEGFITDVTPRVLAYQVLEQSAAEHTAELSAFYQMSAWMRSQAEQRTRELEALSRADDELYRSLDLDQVLQALVNVAAEILRADKADVTVWDAARSRLAAGATYGFTPEMATRMSEGPIEGIRLVVFMTRQPITVEDATADPGVVREIVEAEGIRAMAHVPILVDGEVFGTIGVEYSRTHVFDGHERRVLKTLAQRAALAIKHARLHAQALELAGLKEREQIARDLHDSVAQSLYSLTLLAESGRRHVDHGDLEQTRQHLLRVSETCQQALKEMRLLVHEMRPSALPEEGLVRALEQRLDAVERRAGITAEVLFEGSRRLPVQVEEGLYRIALEALNNAIKHAAAARVTVRICATDRDAELMVRDDGKGFDAAAVEGHSGLGLASMRERGERLGGRVVLCSEPGEGTTVLATVDLSRKHRLHA